MFRRISVLVIIAALAALATVSPAQAQEQKQVAITFDDLPVVSTVHTDEGWAEITAKLLGTMKRNKLPVVGFVNEGKLYSNDKLNPKRVALLKAWLDAGLELGNHTFSHRSLNSTPLR